MRKILSLLTLAMATVAAFATDYKGTLTCNNGTTGEYGYSKSWDEEVTMTATDLGDGTYRMTLDLTGDDYFGENFIFVCDATRNEDGSVSLACEKYAYVLTYGNWAKYKGYITAEATLTDAKLDAKMYVDYGGYAERYPEYGYGYTFTFASTSSQETAVEGIGADTRDAVTHVYTLSGAETATPCKGVNIVRLASGKTMKVLTK